MIPFTPGDAADALDKTVRAGVPEFLDILSASAERGVIHVIKGHRSAMVDWDNMFAEKGDYDLQIAVTCKNSATLPINLKFKWTRDPATSEMIAVS